MSLSSIGSIPPTTTVGPVNAVSTAGGGDKAVPFSLGTTSAGAYIAQGGGDVGDPNKGALVKKMLAGAVVGAGLGFGASFITPIINLIPHAKIILPAAGAAIGALGGLAMHMIGKRKQNLAMQAQAQASGQQAMAPTAMPAQGVTLRANAKGGAARKLQRDLNTLGLHKGKLNGTFDSATADALRRYEVLKGVMPSGKATVDARTAIAEDAKLVKQYT
ncbi:MAG: peptidoglycan-binding domain-containing protein [Gaiellales bacterium]